MKRLAVLAFALPLLIGAAPKPSTHCALASYFGGAKDCLKHKSKKAAKPHAAVAAAQPAPKPPAPKPVPVPPVEPATDLSHAISPKDAVKLPSTKEQFEKLKGQIVHDRPAVIDARQKSDKLKAEALALQQKLVATAARVQALETEKLALDADIARLERDDARLSADFARDRVSVTRLLALLERLQNDMPPAMVLRPDDALAAARSAMLIGASVPSVYNEAAALRRRIDRIQKTRSQLVARRAEGVRNAAQLRAARVELDQLLATKELESDAASSRYGELEARLEKAAVTAADLKALLEKVSALRTRPAQQAIVSIAADKSAAPLQGRMLLVPVAGKQVSGGLEGVGGARAPGLTFAAAPGARVVAPADSEVIFAGPYHKTGQVLILELGAGYDLVLAGLGRVDVRPNDELLAGEPVGIMPNSQDTRLYFELRQNGRGTSPAPYLAVELRKAQR